MLYIFRKSISVGVHFDIEN